MKYECLIADYFWRMVPSPATLYELVPVKKEDTIIIFKWIVKTIYAMRARENLVCTEAASFNKPVHDQWWYYRTVCSGNDASLVLYKPSVARFAKAFESYS